jgi:hypothetical protein
MQVFKLVARHADGRRALCAFPSVPATLVSVMKQTQYDINAWKIFKRSFRCVSAAIVAICPLWIVPNCLPRRLSHMPASTMKQLLKRSPNKQCMSSRSHSADQIPCFILHQPGRNNRTVRMQDALAPSWQLAACSAGIREGHRHQTKPFKCSPSKRSSTPDRAPYLSRTQQLCDGSIVTCVLDPIP